MSDQLLTERRGDVLVVTFSRPEAHNAMTWEMYDGLVAACETADADDGVRSMVLRGAGGKAFIAGTDIAQFREFSSGADGVAYEERIAAVTDRLERVRKPTVAAIDGYCIGGGLVIASVCDLRIATTTAKFGAPIARTLGNCLSMGNYATFIDLIGASRLKEMVFQARLMSADEALTAGFLHQIVSSEQIQKQVAEIAQKVAAHAPLTLWATKEAVRRIQASRPLPDGDDIVRKVYGSADFKEGVKAFVEKRSPRWSGK